MAARHRELIYKAEPKPRQPSERGRQHASAVKADSRANRSLLWRVIFLMCVCGVAMFVPLVAQLYQLQIRDHDYYKQLGVSNQTRDVSVSAGRGSIYDRNGEIMALSATVYTLILSPRDALAKQEIIDEQAAKNPKYERWDVNEVIVDYLTSEFDLEEDSIRAKLAKTKSAYMELVKEIPDDEAKEIREFIRDHKLTSALYLTPGSKRFYPNGSLASHILGFMGYTETSGNQKVGSYGIEAYYEEQLAGKPGRVVTAKNAAGTQMLSSYEAYMDAEEGGNITLTIDEKIQAMAEQSLKTAIEKYYIQKGGQITVLDPNTGAVLANAVYPNYDPNSQYAITDPDTQAELEQIAAQFGTDSKEYSDAQSAAWSRQWRNTSILDLYEPGSTFKPFVVAAALEDGAVSMSDTFYCNGFAEYGGAKIHCHKISGHGSESLTGVLENSCNPAMMKIGVERLGAEKLWQYFEDFGLMEKTGIDVAGEGRGIFWWEFGGKDYFTSLIGESSVATASFGQTFNISPMRMITSFASLINGGHLLKPYFVQTIADGDGNVTYERQTEEIRQVISAETSEKIRTMLESVVANPTASGKNAYCAGYRIGGKTGTAEKHDGTADVVCSFIGFAPADNPKVLVLATFDSPQRVEEGSHHTPGGTYIAGGNIAAPTVGPLIAQILDYMGIEKQYANSDELSGADVIVPALSGKSAEEATALLAERNLGVRVIGDGETVTAQIPAAGASIPGGSQVAVYMGAEPPTDTVTVPNVLGKSPRAVETALNSLGLYVRATGVVNYTGSVSAIDQSITQGTEVARGTVIEVRFADDAIGDSTVQ